jgi:anti-anti-sigma factor
MAFTVNGLVSNGVATITLSGELDASGAPAFREQVEKVSAETPKRLVLMVQDLEYIASAGLRVLIFSKQKMGSDVDIYVVGAQDQVQDTLEKTGFSKSVISVERYDVPSA